MKIFFWRFCYRLMTPLCLLGLTAASEPVSKDQDVELQIGIIQRFGTRSNSKVELSATKSDRLTLKFTTGQQQKTLITDQPVQLEPTMENLPQAQLEEVLVLGDFRTFETAEYNANKWRYQGIEVEIAQPERWQVWAKRDVYNTPLLRRLLLQTIKNSGNLKPYLDTKIQQQKPKITWKIDGKNYTPDYVEISTFKDLIRVNQTDVSPEQNQKASQRKYLYPGKLTFQPNAYGTYTLVNKVPLEIYLRGVVPHEIGINAPQASLESQAIIARTYALKNIRRFAVDNYQLCADTHCQVYQGLTGTAKNTDQAITATKGMVLSYKNELVDALYSSTTGGVTANFSDVWDGEDRPYLKPVIDSPNNIWNLASQDLSQEENLQKFLSLKDGFNETGWDVFRWNKETDIERITKDLQKFLRSTKNSYANFQKIIAMSVIKRSASGRILKLAVKTDIGTVILEKNDVRSAFYAPVSTLFYIRPLNKGGKDIWGYAFIGGGLGHGVGLSQTGAQNLAKLGWNYHKILQFYYPGTEVKVLNQNIK
ncbi:SpoIID/LytB domain-containing protein [Anabaena sp. FACHB-1237]|uniref:SpoIID/LytB domain-containing protein n=1 Tax=Anabaena sp. FACHB-1237 TaxID=2692769 RepID=UPI001680043A|nr:SpoIID/LytB domain-containing protein [Anabaena sp. FACHB-1237]MBD2138916.1 SpoIID/LytB domain-containing protein [Anabaena sp. FACHB-1237]